MTETETSMFLPAFILTFILRLRFPPHKSIVTILNQRYGPEGLATFRAYEKCDLKSRKATCDVEFLTCCQTNNLTPKFIRFKLYSQRLTFHRDYQQFQRRLLHNEIDSKWKLRCNLQRQRQQTLSYLRTNTSWLDFNHLVTYVECNNSKKANRYSAIHRRKLFNLGLLHKHEALKPSEVIFNRSSKVLSEEEQEALAHGLKFGFTPFRLNYTSHFLSFEKLYSIISRQPIYNSTIDSLNHVKASFRNIAYKAYYSFRSNLSDHHKSMIATLKNLSLDNSIIITKPDKGTGVVVMDKVTYIEKMMNILEDTSKFVKCQGDLLKVLFKYEDKVNRFIEKIFGASIITDTERKQLKAGGSRPGIMYGLPKIHKCNTPLRPILSTVGTYNYNLSKYLVSLLSHITDNEYTVTDSFHFAQEISNVSNKDYFMTSFDVVSLFTNIPVPETIDMILSKIFNSNITHFNGFDSKTFRQLLELCTTNNVFLFNEQVYLQKDGAPMGGCVSPTLANIFLSLHEQNWIQNCPLEFRPVYYRRYVDDTFILFKSQSHITKFLNYLNQQHSQIKFTHEIEIDNRLPFLDVLVCKNNNGFATSLFRKQTFTGLAMKYNSAISSSFKLNLVQCLVHRAFKICSSYLSFTKELDFLRNFFIKNGFPQSFIENCFKKKIDNLINPKQTPPTVSKQKIIVSFPFMGNMNAYLRKEITAVFSKYFPHLDFNIIFTNKNTIGSFFRYKDRVPTLCKATLFISIRVDSVMPPIVGRLLVTYTHALLSTRGYRPVQGNLLQFHPIVASESIVMQQTILF